MSGLLGVAEAQARLLGGVVPLGAETVPLAAAAGRILAADLVAKLTQPPFAASAMDGYAIRWADRAGPWRVVGEAAAGRSFTGRVGAGEAARIFTGAPLPVGADTVVVQEDIARVGDQISLTGDGPPVAGAHIRPAGLDFVAASVVSRAGQRMTPARVGLGAAAGHCSVAVYRRPRVVLFATGDELVPPGTMPGRDQIVSSNGAMLAALLGPYAAVSDGGIVADTRAALSDAVRGAADAVCGAADADVIVTIGGASVGDHDLVVPVLRELGATIDFWKIALRPGKPMLSGSLGEARIVGLPGNPVSAFVCAWLFVVPLLRALGGDHDALPPLVAARLGAALPANGSRQDYLRASIDSAGVVFAAARQDSGMLGVLANSNALIVRAPFAPAAAIGETVQCHALDFVPGVA